MRHADELPSLRGWRKSDPPAAAWEEYRQRRAASGPLYTQLVIRLPDGRPIGESFFAPLPEGYAFGRWVKPSGVVAVLGDLKLLPEYWGRGLGTEAMVQVVRWVFTKTDCELFVVPPHLQNPAARRVYEKAGFELYVGMRSAYGHQLMELRRPG
jgi:RimJ/RimL family protein N-acetyltransferase